MAAKFENIVYLDDDPDMLMLIKAVLEQDESISVRIFSSPEKALTDISQHPPDLVILDYLIPEMNGEEVMKHILPQAHKFR